jgi:hypothetical protein
MKAVIDLKSGTVRLYHELREFAAMGILSGEAKAINIDDRTVFNHQTGKWEALKPSDDPEQNWLNVVVGANGEPQLQGLT